MRKARVWTQAVGAALWLLSGLGAAPADASVFELGGAGPRAAAMAGTGVAAARGGSAAFHNPALLLASPLGGAWIGLTATRMDLGVTLQRPVCTLGREACSGLVGGPYADRLPQLPRDSAAVVIGWNFPLGGVLRERVALGAALALPAGHLIRISGPDPQTPHFLRYEGMPDRLALLVSAAVRLRDWWWAGIGTQVLAALDARIDLRVDPTNHRYDQASIGIGLQPRARLVAGMALHPRPDVWFGASWRQRQSLAYQIPTQVLLGEAATIDIGLRHETLFSPDVYAVGAAWRTPWAPLLVTVDLDIAQWSALPDPSPQVSLDAGGPLVDGFGLGQALDVGTTTQPLRLGLRDTLSPALAAEWQPSPSWRLRAGYRWRPTPMPRATGALHYLDNDAHVLGWGACWTFGTLAPRLVQRLAGRTVDPGDLPGPLHLDLWAQLHSLPRRTAIAADPNDPVGSLSHGGAVWLAGVAFGGSF